MKVTVSIGWLIFISLVLIVITYFITQYINEPCKTITIKNRKNYDVVTFKLPNSHNPDIFGPEYWKARHKLAELTPCPACRAEAMSHEVFFHDYVNKKTDKKIQYPDNYAKWQEKINS